jgi:hypothetical protein
MRGSALGHESLAMTAGAIQYTAHAAVRPRPASQKRAFRMASGLGSSASGTEYLVATIGVRMRP